jgi:hypothetical protein
MGARLVLTYLDYGGEKSTVDFPGVSMGAVNFDAQVALQDALELAINPFTIGTKNKRMRVASEVILSAALPASVNAQRENKYLLRFHDNVTGKKYRREIPCADLTQLDTNQQIVSPADPQFIALKAAFEAYVISEDGNAVIMDSLTHVGRNT